MFEWCDNKILWLGSKDDMLIYKDNKFFVCDETYSDKHEYITLIEMLEKSFEE
jgi:hypothetical protein